MPETLADLITAADTSKSLSQNVKGASQDLDSFLDSGLQLLNHPFAATMFEVGTPNEAGRVALFIAEYGPIFTGHLASIETATDALGTDN